MFVSQTKMVQHIRKKHPEFAQLANTIQAPLTTAVISSAPAVISTDGATTEAVVVRKSETMLNRCLALKTCEQSVTEQINVSATENWI